jgi:hypothetical protein
MAERIHPTVAPASIPTTHAYNDPELSPIEFLKAVYHATHLPMSTRIEAASALLPFTEPKPRPTNSFPPRCKIIIGGLGPCSPDPETNTISQPSSIGADNTRQTSSEAVAPVYTETTFYPQTFIDYSTPPTPAELQEIKAAVHALRPDLAHLPPPEPRLCACGHWIFGDCGCPPRNPSKLN